MAQEKSFENKIKKYLDDKDAWYVKYWGGARFTTRGVPDILACVQGTFMGIEVKSSYGKPSPLQLHHLHKIDDAGGWAILAYPDDWGELKDLIDALHEPDYPKARDIYDDLKGRWWYADIT